MSDAFPPDRLPPQNRDAEKSLLGAMLRDYGVIGDVIQLIRQENFYLDAHQKIFAGVTHLFDTGKPVDLVVLAEWLKQQKFIEDIGGYAYLAEVWEAAPSAANAEYYAKIVRDKAITRNLIAASHEILRDSYDQTQPADELLGAAERKILSVAEAGVMGQTGTLIDAMGEAFDRIDARTQKDYSEAGLPTGFLDLDEITAGLHNNELIILAARPSVGKCLSRTAKLLMPDGRLKTIEDVVRERSARLLALRPDWTFAWATPSAFVDDGFKPVYRVTTRLGRQVETTASHPFRTPDGWVPLAELRVGTRVAVPRSLPVFGDRAMRRGEIVRLARSLSGRAERVCAGAGVRMSGPHIPGSDGREPTIPDGVFTLPRPQLALFLNRLWAATGRATTRRDGRLRLCWRSPSERLVRQVQHLLVRFGVLARLRRGAAWRLDVSDPASLHICATELSLGNDAPPSTAGKRVTGDVFWDEIVAIEPLGLRQVYDLTVPDLHNFIADDVCVHNTAFALNIVRNIIVGDDMKNVPPQPVFFVSLEQSRIELAERLLCAQARVDSHRLRKGQLSAEDMNKLIEAGGILRNTHLFIDDSPAQGMLRIAANARRLKKRHDIKLVVIDYLQLIEAENRRDARQEQVAQISRRLKFLARELKIPVMALAQVNRSSEDRQDHRPRLADLRESGSIEQDADTVMLIHRPGKHGDGTEDNIIEILIAKQRNGPTGEVTISYLKQYMRYENYAVGTGPYG